MVAPSFTAKSRRYLIGSITITCPAPVTRPACTTPSPTGPGAYTKPWSGGWSIPWDAGTEPFDYLCQDNNLDPARMVGPQE